MASLHEIFQVERDEFWSWHWTFKSARLTKPQPLLGEARVTDLAVNVVLPWLWIRAKEGGNEKIRREMERRFFAWPAAEDNSVLKLARQRLLGTANARVLKGAAQQQGLMQIVRDFCEHSNAVCADCRFPNWCEAGSAAKSRWQRRHLNAVFSLDLLDFQLGERIVESAGLRLVRRRELWLLAGADGAAVFWDVRFPWTFIAASSGSCSSPSHGADFWRACCAGAG